MKTTKNASKQQPTTNIVEPRFIVRHLGSDHKVSIIDNLAVSMVALDPWEVESITPVVSLDIFAAEMIADILRNSTLPELSQFTAELEKAVYGM